MTKRIQRINALLKREISQLFLREVEFPSDILVTVTRVETPDDLKDSDVFISSLPEEKSYLVIKILNKRIYELQQKINKRLKMRPVPRINFREEKKTGEAGRVEEILEEIKKIEKSDK
jgi:ribosome-binding factor A